VNDKEPLSPIPARRMYCREGRFSNDRMKNDSSGARGGSVSGRTGSVKLRIRDAGGERRSWPYTGRHDLRSGENNDVRYEQYLVGRSLMPGEDQVEH